MNLYWGFTVGFTAWFLDVSPLPLFQDGSGPANVAPAQWHGESCGHNEDIEGLKIWIGLLALSLQLFVETKHSVKCQVYIYVYIRFFGMIFLYGIKTRSTSSKILPFAQHSCYVSTQLEDVKIQPISSRIHPSQPEFSVPRGTHGAPTPSSYGRRHGRRRCGSGTAAGAPEPGAGGAGAGGTGERPWALWGLIINNVN